MAIPVSGPGKFSQRTDRQPLAAIPNADYGEQKAYKQLQQDAPMAQAQAPSGAPMDFSAMFGNPADRVIPLDADSTQPGVPVTDGAALGAGQGTAAMNFGPPRSQQDLQNLASQMTVLEFFANQPGASWGLRQWVRGVKGSL